MVNNSDTLRMVRRAKEARERAVMEKIAISKFKATCLAVLEKVRKTGQPVMVTRFGHPVAEISAPGSGLKPVRKLGAMIGTGVILGDIVGPIGDETDWEAANE
jgi:antitoxin (DNA-binding transcriptional repressor) of toxin-antitoxin stability system